MSQNYPGPANWSGHQPPQGGPQPGYAPQSGYGPYGPGNTQFGPQPGSAPPPQPGFGPQGPGGPGYPPGGPGYPPGDPGYAGGPRYPGGPGYAPSPAPKRKTGLFIGIGAGALVLIVGIVIGAVLLLNQGGPTLSAAQFDKVFAKGDSILGNSIDSRSTTTPDFSQTTGDECERALNKSFEAGEQFMFAMTRDFRFVIVGVRFKDGGAATRAFDAFAGPCADKRRDSGSAEGGKYVVIDISDRARTVVVKTGNVVIMAVNSGGADNKKLAGEIAKEIKNSAR